METTHTTPNEQQAAALRDRLLSELATTGDYKTAITHATNNPEAFYSFPLLSAALDQARNVRIEATRDTMGGHMADVRVLFPALRNIMTQPYAKSILSQIAGWAPRQILKNADSFANQPYALNIITKAMNNYLRTRVVNTYPELPPPEFLFAIEQLTGDQLAMAVRHHDFAKALCEYKVLHQTYYNKRSLLDTPKTIRNQFEKLAHVFSAAEATSRTASDTPPTPSILVLSSPSGGGKSTQIRALLAENPNREFLISYTTRMPRPEEEQDREYHFLSLKYLPSGKTPSTATQDEIATAIRWGKKEFQDMVKKGELIFEHTLFYNNLYGTPRKQLEDGLANGKEMIADINLEGLKEFRKKYGTCVRSIFLNTPIEELERRLIARDITPHAENLSTEQERAIRTTIRKRMEQAQTILDEAHEEIDDKPAYDHIIETGTTWQATATLVKNALSSQLIPPSTVQAGGELTGVLKLIKENYRSA